MRYADHFSDAAAAYAEFRPRYPAALFDALATAAPARDFAWDCGTGNGQAAVALAERFGRVIATDPSAQQLARAPRRGNVEYANLAAGEVIPVPDGSIDLIVAAQAAHWFDHDAFHREVHRVARHAAVVALVCYERFSLGADLDAAVEHFYQAIVGPYWPAERRHIEAGYRTLPFPFAEFELPPFAMEHDWTLDQVIGYLGTWSATLRYRAANALDPLPELREKLAAGYGSRPRRVRWPLSIRCGRVQKSE
jgi:SAM-dependent methyltransferase